MKKGCYFVLFTSLLCFSSLLLSAEDRPSNSELKVRQPVSPEYAGISYNLKGNCVTRPEILSKLDFSGTYDNFKVGLLGAPKQTLIELTIIAEKPEDYDTCFGYVSVELKAYPTEKYQGLNYDPNGRYQLETSLYEHGDVFFCKSAQQVIELTQKMVFDLIESTVSK